MKRIITALVLLLFSVNINAQFSVQRKATGYIKDGIAYYQITGCVPYSELEFYSDPSGGNMLAVVQADNLGEAVVRVPADASYSFALNRVRATKKGDAGIAYHVELGAPVMEVKLINDQAGILQWQVISSHEDITSEVYSSSDGTPYSKIASLQQDDASGNSYRYTTPSNDGDKVAYRIQVTDPASGLKVVTWKKCTHQSK